MPTHVLQSILRASGQNAQKNPGKFGGQVKENLKIILSVVLSL